MALVLYFPLQLIIINGVFVRASSTTQHELACTSTQQQKSAISVVHIHLL